MHLHGLRPKKEHKSHRRQMADGWHNDERVPKNWHLQRDSLKVCVYNLLMAWDNTIAIFWLLHNIKLNNKAQKDHCLVMALNGKKSNIATFW